MDVINMLTKEDVRNKVVLTDMLAHDEVLEKFPWLSAQILNKWKRLGAIRFFRGANGKFWYPEQDLNDALNANLQLETPAERTPQSKVAHRNSADADEVRERMFFQSLEANGTKKGIRRGPRKPRTAVLDEC